MADLSHTLMSLSERQIHDDRYQHTHNVCSIFLCVSSFVILLLEVQLHNSICHQMLSHLHIIIIKQFRYHFKPQRHYYATSCKRNHIHMSVTLTTILRISCVNQSDARIIDFPHITHTLAAISSKTEFNTSYVG